VDRLATALNSGKAPRAGAIEEWNEAYVTVESYFLALGIRHRLRLSRLIHQALDAAERRLEENPGLSPSAAAMEETIRLVAEWFSQVVDVKLPENRLAARGRLSLFLADLPERYQAYFLAEPPLPPEVVSALKESYLTAAPKFQRRTMAPKPIALNPIMKHATLWWTGLHHAPIVKAMVVGTFLAMAGAAVMLFFWR